MNKTEAVSRLAAIAAGIEGLPDGTNIQGCGLNGHGKHPYIQIPHEQLTELGLRFSCHQVTPGSLELKAKLPGVDIVAIRFSPLQEEGEV